MTKIIIAEIGSVHDGSFGNACKLIEAAAAAGADAVKFQTHIAAAETLAEMDGVDQVAPFGMSLHVVGQNRTALRAAVERVVQTGGLDWREDQTSLEDVFIQYMGESTDNMA